MPQASSADIARFAGLRRGGSFDSDIGADAYQIAGERAERKAREEISDKEYDEIVSKKGGAKASAHQDLREAEALLMAYYALPSLNLRITKKGGLQRRTGTVDNENDLMSKSEMDSYREEWYGDAMDIFDTLSPDTSDERNPVYAI